MVDGESLYSYWPVFLILIGVSHFVRPEGSRCIFSGLVWIAIGSIILLSNLGFIAFEIWDLWPVVLVILGANLLFGGARRRYRRIERGAGRDSAPTV